MKQHLPRYWLTAVCVGFLLTLQLAAIPAQARTKPASLHGVARVEGVPVAGVSIVVRCLQNHTARVVFSSADGTFRVNLRPGSYELTATKAGAVVASVTKIDLAAQRSVSVDVALNAVKLPPAAPPETSDLLKELASMKERIAQLEAMVNGWNARTGPPPVDTKPVLVAGAAPDPAAQNPALPQRAVPVPPAAPAIPEPLEAPDPAPKVDNFTPFAFGDFSWLNGNPRNNPVLETKFFTPEVRFDTHFMQSFNQPIDHTMGGSTESFRSGEFQEEQISVGGDFHWQNVRGRVLYMMGLFATTTPRNDASAGVGQWELRNAYRYVSEAWGGYHFNVSHGLNVDAGIFVSYIGLFSYYNFDNWAYQPSFVSSNTPWFFNGLRIQWFPTKKLKIEPWIINGWQSYAKFNGHHGLGGQILYRPKEWLSLVFNNYGNGTDTLGIPGRSRIHTDNSIQVRYFHDPDSPGISQMAFSVTGDAGCEYGGGVTCHGGSGGPKQSFLGWMAYNRIWWNKDRYAITLGGGKMNNPGRYLTLLPPINGADAVSGSPYFTANPGDQARMWDATATFNWMPRKYITWWLETGYRHSNVPYWSGRGGITPPGGNNNAPSQFVCITGAPSGTNNLAAAQIACGGGPASIWYPDLRRGQANVSAGILVKF